MVLKSLNGAGRWERLAWKGIRHFVPKNVSWFYEGHPDIPGQMWFADRRALYETVIQYKPQVVCESGTWLGGGSTFFIAKALYKNGMGLLHTTETDPAMYASAVENYDRYLSDLRPFVRFHQGTSLSVYPDILKPGSVDALLLDGAEDAEATFAEFRMFEPFLSPSAILMAHDWYTEKTALLKPHLEQSPEWKLVQYIPPPKSVGFAVFERVT